MQGQDLVTIHTNILTVGLADLVRTSERLS